MHHSIPLNPAAEPAARCRLRLASLVLCLLATAASAETGPRERLLLDTGWRFTRGDPADAGMALDYDRRPPIEAGAGTTGEGETPVPDAAPATLKPWILPSGNAFIREVARRHTRPDGNPGGAVSYVQADFDDSDWDVVTLPHDWAINGPFIETGPYGGMGRLPSWGVGWYRRDLEIPASDAGRSVFLDVEGAMAYASVWLNGRLVGGWPYGYNSWRLDLTPFIRPGGPNRLAMRLENLPESSRWYPGGGLYRDVWLTKTGPVHVGLWGTTITTPTVSARAATVNVAVTVDNAGDDDARITATTTVYALDDEGRQSSNPLAHIDHAPLRIEAGGSASTEGSATIGTPRLWGPPPGQVPHMHVAVTTLRQGNRIADRYETRFGIRRIDFDPDRGVLVNGEHVPLQGVNNHHDLGALGAAFNRRAAERQLEILREMGANAVRMAHNPPAPALLDLADRMGFLVVDEIFDVWQQKKTPLDFHLIFDDWHEPDLRAFIRRDRNHPSVILWSVGNEVGEQTTGEAGAAIAARLVEIAHEEDPTRPVTTAMNWANADMRLPATMDVINLNYQGVGVRTLPSDFPAFRKHYPDKVVFSSESAAAVSSRGEFLFPVSGNTSGPVRPGVGGDPKSRHVSAYEIHAADFGSSADQSFALHDQHPWVAGEFVWSGFDYLGEPTPYYDSRSSYFGIVDLAGLPKDRYYLYQSRWRADLPMAHILPHWTWPGREGEVTPVHVFTSGDEAELFLNGQSLGRQAKAPYQYRLRWDYVEYEPGELEVVAYRDGKEWARAAVSTAGPAAKLELTVDRAQIAADGRDLAFVTLRVTDAEGRTAPRADNPVRFAVDGPGELVATDNGDPTSFVPFASPERRAFNGYVVGIVRGLPGETGRITVRVSAGGLEPAIVDIETSLER